MPGGQSSGTTLTPQVANQVQSIPVTDRKKAEAINISERRQPKIVKAPTPEEPLPKAALKLGEALGNGNGSSQAGFGDNGGGGILPVGLIPAAVERSVKPPYPVMARKLGFEGQTRLQLAINSQGLVSDASIVQSSGRADVDHAARQTLRDEWRFRPARLFGHPIASSTAVVVVFSLRD